MLEIVIIDKDKKDAVPEVLEGDFISAVTFKEDADGTGKKSGCFIAKGWMSPMDYIRVMGTMIKKEIEYCSQGDGEAEVELLAALTDILFGEKSDSVKTVRRHKKSSK